MQFSVTDGLKRAARRFGDSSAMSVAVVDRLEKNSAQRCRVRSYFFFDEDFLRGTLAPAFRAWDNPIAIACFLLVTFLPERPLLRVPFFRSFIAFSTFSVPSCRTWPWFLLLRISCITFCPENQAAFRRGFPYKSRNSSLAASSRLRRDPESCFPARLI